MPNAAAATKKKLKEETKKNKNSALVHPKAFFLVFMLDEKRCVTLYSIAFLQELLAVKGKRKKKDSASCLCLAWTVRQEGLPSFCVYVGMLQVTDCDSSFEVIQCQCQCQCQQLVSCLNSRVQISSRAEVQAIECSGRSLGRS